MNLFSIKTKIDSNLNLVLDIFMNNLPKNAEKVFKGVLFDVYQWPQEVYNNSVRTFEKLVRKPSADVLAVVKDKIVILEQEQPTKPLFPSLPGGMIEENQAPLEAAQAELLQETGFEAQQWSLAAEFFGSLKIFFHEYLFVARGCQKVVKQQLDGGEKIRVTFKKFEDFLQLARDRKFTAPLDLKFMMYEALLDNKKQEELRKMIFGD
jgi:ADP-ribose pyrophosphatase